MQLYNVDKLGEGFAVGRSQRRSYIETVVLAGRVYCTVATIFCRYYDRLAKQGTEYMEDPIEKYILLKLNGLDMYVDLVYFYS